MSFALPSTVVPTSDERELLLRFLHRQREEVVATAEGLSDDDARWTPDGRLLPIVGIINHLTHAEWRWIEGRYLGREFPPRTDEFAPDSPTIDGVRAAYWAQAQSTDEIVRAAPSLEAPCVGREGGLATRPRAARPRPTARPQVGSPPPDRGDRAPCGSCRLDTARCSTAGSCDRERWAERR